MESHATRTQVESEGPAKRGLEPAIIDKALLWIVALLIAAIMALLAVNFFVQYSAYKDAVNSVKAATPTDYVTILTYMGAWDGAVTKLCSLFLSFTLIFVGALYVLRTAQLAYALGVEGGGFKGTLQTTSPGLVILTLGVVALGLALYKSSSVDLTAGYDQFRPQTENQKSLKLLETPATEYKSPNP